MQTDIDENTANEGSYNTACSCEENKVSIENNQVSIEHLFQNFDQLYLKTKFIDKCIHYNGDKYEIKIDGCNLIVQNDYHNRTNKGNLIIGSDAYSSLTGSENLIAGNTFNLILIILNFRFVCFLDSECLICPLMTLAVPTCLLIFAMQGI